MVILAVAAAEIIQNGTVYPLEGMFPACFAVIFCAIVPNILFGCYPYISKYAGLSDAIRLVVSSAMNLLLLLTAVLAGRLFSTAAALPDFGAAFVCVLIEVYLMGLARFSRRILLVFISIIERLFNNNKKQKVVVFCVPDDCRIIIDRVRVDNKKLAAVLCGSPSCSQYSRISGVPVNAGNADALCTAVRKHGAQEVIISKDILSREALLRVVRACRLTGCSVKIYGGIEQFALSGPREINIENLLGRTQTVQNTDKTGQCVRDKNVLVTGGAGSIGSELCRQTLQFGCRQLLALDISENGLFELDNALTKAFGEKRHRVIVGSVRDASRLEEIFEAYNIDIVFHAAAHKHVPLMEQNPAEAIKNNVFGTLNTAMAAIEHGAEKFILISTDKAVNCVNVMGATKRLSEMIIQHLNQLSAHTKLAAVRFGNVLGSNGSVCPIFQRQIEAGGPVTVTHPDVERYFMTILEAVELVLQAGAMAEGGEIFTLEMGRPRKIVELARDMIRLYGHEPGRDIHIEYSGLRPGEKLYEELSFQYEKLTKTENEKIYSCSPANIESVLLDRIAKLRLRLEQEQNWDKTAAFEALIECGVHRSSSCAGHAGALRAADTQNPFPSC